MKLSYLCPELRQILVVYLFNHCALSNQLNQGPGAICWDSFLVLCYYRITE